MIDSLVTRLEQARRSSLPGQLGLQSKRFAYVTLHRPFNVDDKDNLVLIMDELTRLAENLPVVFPSIPVPGKCLSNMALPSMVDQTSS